MQQCLEELILKLWVPNYPRRFSIKGTQKRQQLQVKEYATSKRKIEAYCIAITKTSTKRCVVDQSSEDFLQYKFKIDEEPIANTQQIYFKFKMLKLS